MGLFDLFKKKNSGNVAKDRLKLLLVSDRANCSPDIMEMIKNDIINFNMLYFVNSNIWGNILWKNHVLSYIL